jgi:hypothetical protein
MLSAPEATAALSLAMTSLNASALSTAAQALARHVAGIPEAARSSGTQRVVTAQQHLLVALPALSSAGGAGWARQREDLVTSLLGTDQASDQPEPFC